MVSIRAVRFYSSRSPFITYAFGRIPIETRLPRLGSVFSNGPKMFVVMAAVQFALAVALFAYTSRQVSSAAVANSNTYLMKR